MKTISSILMFISISFIAMSQVKKVELFDVVKSLVPDSAQVGNSVPWTQLSKPGQVILFKGKPQVNQVTKKSLVTTDANISINSQTFSCGGKAGCTWSVSLEGNSNSYNQISISPDLSQEPTYQTDIKYLFGKKQYSSKLLKKCDDSSDMATYEIKIPGKKTFWIQSSMSGGTEGSAIYINCYFNKSELSLECF